jgi:hypothetical protein
MKNLGLVTDAFFTQSQIPNLKLLGQGFWDGKTGLKSI